MILQKSFNKSHTIWITTFSFIFLSFIYFWIIQSSGFRNLFTFFIILFTLYNSVWSTLHIKPLLLLYLALISTYIQRAYHNLDRYCTNYIVYKRASKQSDTTLLIYATMWCILLPCINNLHFFLYFLFIIIKRYAWRLLITHCPFQTKHQPILQTESFSMLTLCFKGWVYR